MTIERPEPSFRNTEVGMLRSNLDQPLPPSDLTLGGMLKHLAWHSAAGATHADPIRQSIDGATDV